MKMTYILALVFRAALAFVAVICAVPEVRAQSITEFQIPFLGSQPGQLTSDSLGNLWFTDSGTHAIGMMTPSGVTSEHSLPSGGRPTSITRVRDGSFWFAENGFGQVGHITAAGAITELRSIVLGPGVITQTPDGTIYFTDTASHQIGRISSGGSASIAFSVSTNDPAGQNGGGCISGIAADTDGSLWIGNGCPPEILHMNTSGATLEAFPLSHPGPLTILLAPDGAIWFTEIRPFAIVRLDRSGSVQEFPISASSENITIDADGALWFTDGLERLGVVSPAGTVSEIEPPTQHNGAFGITVVPNGNVWFAEAYAGKLGTVEHEAVGRPPVIPVNPPLPVAVRPR